MNSPKKNMLGLRSTLVILSSKQKFSQCKSNDDEDEINAPRTYWPVWLVPRVGTPKPSRKTLNPLKLMHTHQKPTPPRRNGTCHWQGSPARPTALKPYTGWGTGPVLVARVGWEPTRHLPGNGVTGWPPISPGGLPGATGGLT